MSSTFNRNVMFAFSGDDRFGLITAFIGLRALTSRDYSYFHLTHGDDVQQAVATAALTAVGLAVLILKF